MRKCLTSDPTDQWVQSSLLKMALLHRLTRQALVVSLKQTFTNLANAGWLDIFVHDLLRSVANDFYQIHRIIIVQKTSSEEDQIA